MSEPSPLTAEEERILRAIAPGGQRAITMKNVFATLDAARAALAAAERERDEARTIPWDEVRWLEERNAGAASAMQALTRAREERDAAVALAEARRVALEFLRECIVSAREVSWTAKFEREHPSVIPAIDAALAMTDAEALEALRERVRAEAFEEAAKVADAENNNDGEDENSECYGIWAQCAEQIALDLRTLAGGRKGDGNGEK